MNSKRASRVLSALLVFLLVCAVIVPIVSAGGDGISLMKDQDSSTEGR